MELRLPTFREHHSSQAALASKESWSYPQYLLALSELEVADRRERRIQRRRRTSKLPWDKSLTALDRSRLPQSVDRQLSVLVEGDFLDRAENLLVFGNPGSGKTHLVCCRPSCGHSTCPQVALPQWVTKRLLHFAIQGEAVLQTVVGPVVDLGRLEQFMAAVAGFRFRPGLQFPHGLV